MGTEQMAGWPVPRSGGESAEHGETAGHEAHPGGTAASGETPDSAGPTPADHALQPAGTGEPRVDAALRLLDRLPGLPVSEHAELYEQVREQLSDVLGELDTGPGN
jgi:hypothetical protein